MDFDVVRLEQRVKLFSDMILCCHDLYYTIFTTDYTIHFQNFPETLPVKLLFIDSADWEHMNLLAMEAPKPVIYSTDPGLSWVIEPYPSDQCIHVLGPFFLTDVSAKDISDGLEKRGFSLSVKRQVASTLLELPVISINRMLEYAMMLHFCLFNERITIDSIQFLRNPTEKPVTDKVETTTVTHGTYEAEQEMLRIVREGDLNYRPHMNKIAVTGSQGKLSNNNPLRQAKNSILVAVTLFSRAAIDGGLDPEISYTLTDYYFQSVEACDNIADLADIMHAMQDDFIQRVHSCRASTEYSAPVRSCIDYLDYHLEDEINWKELVCSLGYNDYYFSKKFKKETGLSPNEYLLEKRFDRAKFLLKKTNQTVNEISMQLRFCSQSYFTEQFGKRFGMTPLNYRKNT